ncbi:hypothetical protein FRC11_004475 [Ceratobasidium sp. 423]|nr:hypothetical protein FRC11_004475 [Ceratobasidium sp. 423]
MSNNRGFPSTTQKIPRFLIAEYGGDKAVILRNVDYQKTLGFVKEVFPSAHRAVRIILNAQLDEDDMIEITEEVWSCMVTSLTLIHVELDHSRWERVYVRTQWGGNYYEIDLAMETVEGLKQKVEDREGIPSSEQHLWNFNSEIYNGYKLVHYGVRKGSTLLALDEAASMEHSRRGRPGCMGHA